MGPPSSRVLVAAYIYRFHLSIDHALAVSYRRDVRRDNPKFVARVTLVKAVPFYGFHVGYRFFLKIYMLKPNAMTRLADLLQQGLIMDRKFQPYEAHLQYLLQFMTDYNLYGCAYIEASRVSFRAPVPNYEEDEEPSHLWHSQSIPSGMITDDHALPRASHCPIEVDICVQDILNRTAVKERRLHHDFVERIHPLPTDMKLVHSMAGLWKDETKRRKRLMRNPTPGSSPFPADALISMSVDPRNSQPSGWIHEEEYRQRLQDLAAQEELAMGEDRLSFETFVSEDPMADNVKTVLQSVEDFFPENLSPVPALAEGPSEDISSSIIVDEEGLLDFDSDQDDADLFPGDSDEELIEAVDKAAAMAGEKEQNLAVVHTDLAQGDTTQHAPRRSITSTELTASSVSVSRDTRTVNGLAFGVSTSGLQSGHPPHIPICPELLAEAKAEGLVSRKPPTKQRRISPGSPHKRHRETVDDLGGGKRLKLAQYNDFDGPVPAPPGRLSTLGVIQRGAEYKPDGDGVKNHAPVSSQPRRSAVKEGSSNKHSSSQTLKFAVVKDPEDPSTKLRLSQHSSSQPSESGTVKKQVTFDSSLTDSGSWPSLSEIERGLVNPQPPSFLRSTISEGGGHSKLIWDSPKTVFSIRAAPPSITEVVSTMQLNGLPDVIYQDAFYSNEKDVPVRAREYAGREFRLESNTVPYLPNFDETGQSPAAFGMKPDSGIDRLRADVEFDRQRRLCCLKSWEIAEPPPSFDEVNGWWQKRQKSREVSRSPKRRPQSTQDTRPYQSQIDGPTPRNKHGFKYSQKQKSTSVQHEAQYMSTMSLEVHVNTRGKLVPNPEEDEVQCLFWSIGSDDHFARGTQSPDGTVSGIIVLSEDGSLAEQIRRQVSCEVLEETSELAVMVAMVEIVRTHDPDILTGYEVHGSSWGYLIERARFKYDYGLCDEFSRMKSQSHGRFGKEADKWGFNTTSTIRVTGRHMINIWRAMRGEFDLLQYTMENVAWHLLHRRVPHYSWRTLTDWYRSGRHRDLAKVLNYYLVRSRLDIQILETNELIPRTSEQARVLGVDFFSVFSRGSQFKVESIMFRIAKPENFILVSPSKKQVGSQNALECIPLVMEPQSAFYNSPLLVLDFQSLYPSVMIAYNYCYSTFLGRIVNWRGTNKMGFTDYKRRQGLIHLLRDYINITPNGMMYTKPHIRKSLLSKMLAEILETRVMVKSGMKQDKDDKVLQQLLNNRQLALKLLANVTYGYTSASFSGRMPCSEIADSIVQTARETLERSIAFIHSVERWGAEVVYGDTDSLFIYLKGRTRDQAFDIGNEIAKAVTDMNPRPVKLKFEKVYHPCVLLAKKRYVGYKYESRDQLVPEFDAKGIETVRRDGTPAEQKIEEKTLKLLFETADLSQVKSYFQAQCDKIMRGAVSVQDFCFAKEVRLGTYSDKGPPPPGALISTKRMLEDARAEPQYGERVPYVVITGAPGARLIDRCVSPEDLLNSSHCTLDAEYYISKNLIPPLERIFNLVGANVRQWYDEMPKVQRIRRVDASSVSAKKTLESYLKSALCVVCGVRMKGERAVCGRCRREASLSMVQLQTRLNAEERKLAEVEKVCQSCAAFAPLDKVPCDSKDCPVFYTRVKQATRLRAEKGALEPVIRELAELRIGKGALDW